MKEGSIAVALAIGVAIGVAMDDVGMGIGIGLALAIAASWAVRPIKKPRQGTWRGFGGRIKLSVGGHSLD